MFLQILCFPVLILFFYSIHTQGKMGVVGSPLFLRYNSFYYALSLSASNWGYLYFSLLWQGNSFLFSFGEREGDWGYLYC